MRILPILLTIFRSVFRARGAVELENFALWLNVLKRSMKQRPRLTQSPAASAQSCENLDRAWGLLVEKTTGRDGHRCSPKTPPIFTEIYMHRSGVGHDLILHPLPQIA